MSKRLFLAAALLGCGLAAYYLCDATTRESDPTTVAIAQEDSASQEDAAAPTQPGAVVAVSDAIEINDLQPRQYAARLEPIDDVDIVPRVTGWIEKVNFKEGDFVNAGDLLFEIEDTTYQVAVKTAEANLEQISAEVKNAETNYTRAKDLLERQAGSQADFDDAEQRLLQARAAYRIGEAALVDARNTLSYTKIRTPISGRIGKVTVTRGNLVTPQTGKIVDVKSFAPIHVRFAIGESVFNKTFGGEGNIRERARIKICPVGEDREDAKKIEEYPEATIDLIDNKVDSSTNTVVIWATLPNQDNRFFPGSYATALVSRKLEKPAIGVLLSALQTSVEDNYVYVVDANNCVERRTVKLGPISGKYQIIDAGVRAGETIVVEGMNKLEPGAKVQPIDYETLETRLTNERQAAEQAR
ncbi:MAG: efflux RND transporter periplasmic adaptor subunit [Planctomycetia bacterium]|nr:efflux RND transporter periplasmic adaptor subunit [Planctomycetia bacterium]